MPQVSSILGLPEEKASAWVRPNPDGSTRPSAPAPAVIAGSEPDIFGGRPTN